MTASDRLVGIAQTQIAIGKQRLKLIDDGHMETYEIRDGVKVNTTQETRDETENLIDVHNAFIGVLGK